MTGRGDLSGVEFADCSLLNTLLLARSRRHLVLAGPLPHEVRRLFDLTSTAAVFGFAPDTTAACASRTRTAQQAS
ncbi:hypothetical protein [Streptacidiphilus cavernicola]|uniref:STAS domain-containing protein n=1 Tax=Streptacidiphilus cavernicola TaxID=3342716 RepID=A0ABV6VX39_9ACTN